MTATARRWNHNLHYHPVILDAVPDGCERALDTLVHTPRRYFHY